MLYSVQQDFKKSFGVMFSPFSSIVFFSYAKRLPLNATAPISVVKLKFFVAVVEIIIFNYSLFEIGEFEIKLILCRI